MAHRHLDPDFPLSEASFSDTGYASASASGGHTFPLTGHPPLPVPPQPSTTTSSHSHSSGSVGSVARPPRTSSLSIKTPAVYSASSITTGGGDGNRSTDSVTLHTATVVAVSRTSRSQTLSQSSSQYPKPGISPISDSASTPQSPTSAIKRKPLSKTASPLATRFSSGDYLVAVSKNYQRPEQRFSRAYSVDSPTIYDFDVASPAAVAAASISKLPALETPYELEQEHGEDKFQHHSQHEEEDERVACASPSMSIQSASSFYQQYQEGDTDFEDLQELQSPATGSREHDFATRNIPALNPGILQTEVPDYLAQYEDFNTPIDASPTDDPLLDLILAEEGGDSYEGSEVSGGHSIDINSASAGNNMFLSSRKGPTPPHLDFSHKSRTTQQDERSTSLQATTQIITPAIITTTTIAAPDSPRESISSVPGSIRALDINKPLPKNPPQEPKSPAGSSKLATFFGWSSGGSPSSVDFSDKGYSPLLSPLSPKPTVYTDDSPLSPRPPETTAASQTTEASTTSEKLLKTCESYLQTPTPAITSSLSAQLDEMEDELKAISTELAASIRREIDLEDLVDRLQSEINNPQGPGKRTSDYFSDSGISTAKLSEYDQNREEVERIQRRSEQEKAQLRLELTSKVQDERDKRKGLDHQIQDLAAKASQVDIIQMNSADANGRLKELESTCDDLRRRLSEERQVKENFEDLLTGLKGELQSAENERDNLRDEIVPQLRVRVEGLEAQATDSEKLAYETTKMQQELSSLKEENTTLKKAKKQDQLGSLPNQTARTTLGKLRSNSVTAAPPPALSLALPPAVSLSRSISVKNPNSESREALSERLKDVEAQRDALHSALKNLLERQEFQNRENEKKIKTLEIDRDRLLASSPRKANYEKEVTNLRSEINVLRRRAEEAIEQRWQVEKGLAGLKMDLDRAEEEITSLRALLQEKDILIPEFMLSRASSFGQDHQHLSGPVTSASLDEAYHQLKTRYSDALERIKSLEVGTPNGQLMDEKTSLALGHLQQSLANAVSERDLARSEVKILQGRVDSLRSAEQTHLESEAELAAQLTAAASRVEDLAAQVSHQLSANASLRRRLAESVARGEAAQKSDTARITQMQARLRQLEDQLVTSQTAAEERVGRHEEEIALIREGLANQDLHRQSSSTNLRVGSPLAPPRSPALRPRSPRSPLFAPPRSPLMSLTPRRNSSRSAGGRSDREDQDSAAQVLTLKARVSELERALSDTENEMQEIVGRMSEAQIEVLTLQEEREVAMRETRKLQKLIQDEQVRAFEERFRNISVAAQVGA
ncbi:uncharacterized protein MKZ38_004794 [Zalerion maritima]|uniref:DUF7603 domain-containing protein n=1 Tax=Zalerion maritima TaxID=339359 RepID=A0AAD5WPP1_9PEZI|nr:uncharacterized protein MKZ38_004794 [Zalerion maritima]